MTPDNQNTLCADCELALPSQLTIEVEQRRYVRGQLPTWELRRTYTTQGRVTEKRIYTDGGFVRAFTRADGHQIAQPDRYRYRVTAIDGKPLNEN